MAASHTVFLGMAAGVGKTFRMLGDGHGAVAAGRDVVVGVLETHGRRATAAAAEGLELLPRRDIAHGSIVISELDLPGVLARRPELCLVDELAHSNPPGLEHAKRHEDVAAILAAGIDVFSTVNVQHLESLNDQVFELTGVRVRETLPDAVLTRADQVVLVDLTPEALIARLRAGDVYPAERIGPALNGFFRVEHLQALRQVALRQVAEDVEARRLVRPMVDAREERLFSSTETQPIAERLLALVSLDAGDERVLRRAWRSAQRLGAELDVLVVRPPESAPGAKERDRLESLRRLAATLGAHLLIEGGSDTAEVAARVARERGTTYVLIAAPPPRRGLARLSEPVALALLHALPGVDLRIVAERGRPTER